MSDTTRPARHLAALALCLPLALTACTSSNGSGSPASTGSPPSTTTSGKAAPTGARPTPTIPIAISYVLTPSANVTDRQLNEALKKVGALRGVKSVSLSNKGKRQLRVDMDIHGTEPEAQAVYRELAKLGSVAALS